jgi:hypothetical protein
LFVELEVEEGEGEGEEGVAVTFGSKLGSYCHYKSICIF